MSKNSTLTVLPLAMSPMELRVVRAALTLSHERGRRLKYSAPTSNPDCAPDIVLVSINCDRKGLERQMADSFGEHALASMRWIMINGSDALDPTPQHAGRLLTPYGLLECLDRVTGNRSESAKRSIPQSALPRTAQCPPATRGPQRSWQNDPTLINARASLTA